MSQNVQNLFNSAQQEGTLTQAGSAVLAIPDMGAQIQAGLGINVGNVSASEVLLVSMLIDDSGSIRFGSNSDAVRQGANLVLEALGKSKAKDSILVHCRYLNGTVLYPYVALDQAVKLDSTNYNPNGGTPLYDQSAVILGTVIAKTQEFSDAGVPVRSVTLIVTDGADEHSTKHKSASSLRPLVIDMLRAETHIVAAMGIDDGGRTNFRGIFGEMGVDPRWILTPGATPSEIRKAFEVASQSALRASQATGATFSNVAGGGFGA
jgi:hypothetical protein